MKNTLYLFVIISIAFLSSCKKDDTKPETANCEKEQTIIVANGSQSGTKFYSYNDRSLLEKELYYDVNGDLTDSFYHSYDGKGRLVSSYFYNYPYAI